MLMVTYIFLSRFQLGVSMAGHTYVHLLLMYTSYIATHKMMDWWRDLMGLKLFRICSYVEEICEYVST